jgi:dephospho-CoA kinase
MLIGLVGLIGSGKDTVAEFLVKEHKFQRDSFAKSLKDKDVFYDIGANVGFYSLIASKRVGKEKFYK